VDLPAFQLNRDGDVPLGTQLAWQIQALITGGRLRPGEQLPSVRRLAEVAGVNVNTVRSVYERLEGEGFVVTRHGRGTFVAENVPQLDPGAVAARVYASSGSPPTRAELREQISLLESQLGPTGKPASERPSPGPRILATDELLAVRDELASRLDQLDAMRDELVELLASIRIAIGEENAEQLADKTRPGRAPTRVTTVRPRPAAGR